MNFNFGEVLTRAWQIIWKHKVLWVFGILAGCAQSRSGGNFSGNGGGGRGSDFNPNNPAFRRSFEEAVRWLSENWWVVVLVVVILFVISILFYLIGVIGKIGLIKGTFKADNGAEAMSFGELWSESTPYMWRVFLLSFLIGLAFLVIFLPIFLIGIATAGIGFACLLPLICILIPAAWVMAVVIEQANNAIVLENLGIWDGFKRGWEVSKKNWAPLLVMAIILMLGGGIVGVIFALPNIFAVLPIIIGAASKSETALLLGFACCALYLPVLIFLNGILTAYIQSAWTLTYMRLTQPKDNAPVFVEGNAQ